MRRHWKAAVLAAVTLTLSVVSPASAVNPIITTIYTADPATFGAVNTTRLRLNIMSRSGLSTGMLEWLALN